MASNAITVWVHLNSFYLRLSYVMCFINYFAMIDKDFLCHGKTTNTKNEERIGKRTKSTVSLALLSDMRSLKIMGDVSDFGKMPRGAF
uniref:Uncharacterized protein n=1 Tax=Glossina pallidipes TaxID=7398 RepID=A0A1B0AGC4_GLOPL